MIPYIVWGIYPDQQLERMFLLLDIGTFICLVALEGQALLAQKVQPH